MALLLSKLFKEQNFHENIQGFKKIVNIKKYYRSRRYKKTP
ncbi:MAG: hypothetical protein UW95_C0001G0049 [Parcubacteria group bacterium GW2011_GWC1_45_14]|nr:MAG: hypothetical protein UW87_C0004G0027 [Candidatus Moranbacteria bacterium GW2011_GWC2_45_10]KKT95485.1 MAG: hypothetical protein UW95_C0001G0049 [Parcubacteria group bacterium GW2011_GWC1_45_14]